MRPAGEDVVAVRLDLVQYAAVECPRRGYAPGRPGRKVTNAGVCLPVDLPCARYLESHERAPLWRHPSAPDVGTETAQVLEGEVHPPTVEVFAYVPQEVGDLKGNTQLAGGLEGRRHRLGPSTGSIISPITAAEPSMYPHRSSQVS